MRNRKKAGQPENIEGLRAIAREAKIYVGPSCKMVFDKAMHEGDWGALAKLLRTGHPVNDPKHLAFLADVLEGKRKKRRFSNRPPAVATEIRDIAIGMFVELLMAFGATKATAEALAEERYGMSRSTIQRACRRLSVTRKKPRGELGEQDMVDLPGDENGPFPTNDRTPMVAVPEQVIEKYFKK